MGTGRGTNPAGGASSRAWERSAPHRPKATRPPAVRWACRGAEGYVLSHTHTHAPGGTGSACVGAHSTHGSRKKAREENERASSLLAGRCARARAEWKLPFLAPAPLPEMADHATPAPRSRPPWSATTPTGDGGSTGDGGGPSPATGWATAAGAPGARTRSHLPPSASPALAAAPPASPLPVRGAAAPPPNMSGATPVPVHWLPEAAPGGGAARTTTAALADGFARPGGSAAAPTARPGLVAPTPAQARAAAVGAAKRARSQAHPPPPPPPPPAAPFLVPVLPVAAAAPPPAPPQPPAAFLSTPSGLLALKRGLRSAAAAGDVAGLHALLRVAAAATAAAVTDALTGVTTTASPAPAALAATRTGAAVLDLTRHPDGGVAGSAAVLARAWRVGVGAAE